MPHFKIGNRLIGDGLPPVVFAEIGINHGGNLDVAISIAEKAIESGAEFIKHQTHIVEDEMSNEAKDIIPRNADISILEIMKKCSLTENDELKLMRHIECKGAIFISTPFSRAAVDRLIRFNVPAFKVGSGECNNYPLIRYIAKFNKPVILSTGMNSLDSIKTSVEILRKSKIPIALLHCTNIYPTPPELVRLGAMIELKNEFPDCVVGLSDHTTSNFPCLGAVALGASIVERHFTDSMSRQGPDIICSMDPDALKELIKGIDILFRAGGGNKGPLKEELGTIDFAFASVVAIEDIPEGGVLSEKNIWVKRPGGGDYSAKEFEKLIGVKAIKFIPKGYQIKKEQLF